jgi:hypothetical protein
MARREAGGRYTDTPSAEGQGSRWHPDMKRSEYNQLYMQTLPPREGGLAGDSELARYLSQLGTNMDQLT